jgi:DNA-binding beta-propeller fold protein YncE
MITATATAAGGGNVSMTVIGRYETGVEGGSEVVAYDAATQKMFITNGDNDSVDIVDISDPMSPTLLAQFDISPYGGGINSVAVYSGVAVAAVEAFTVTDPGTAVFLDHNGNYINDVEVGALPDMVTYDHAGQNVLVANEGEPDGGVDPAGSVSIIDVSGGAANITQADVSTADFTAFDGMEDQLRMAGVRIFSPTLTSIDVEPEYIAVAPDDSEAWVTLQEANAVAVVDIANATVLDIVPLGLKDHSAAGNMLDASDRDGPGGSGAINIQNWPVFGMYMPDSITSFEANGTTYYVTANEGDARNEDERVGNLMLDPTVFTDAATLQMDENLGRYEVSTIDGDTDGDGMYEALHGYGARSFTIWDANGVVFDSGDDFGMITAMEVPEIFNSNGTTETFDTRSDAKGAEPEAITFGRIAGKEMIFIGLERTGGVMVYDASMPTQPQFELYEAQSGGDLAPETMVFVPAADSPNGNPLLLVAFEISGSTTVYQVDYLGPTDVSLTMLDGTAGSADLVWLVAGLLAVVAAAGLFWRRWATS